MKVIAKSGYVGISPRKLRLVAKVVEGKRVEDALAQLRFLPSPGASKLAKVIRSATANAENNYQLNTGELRVTKIDIGDGPTLRRLRPQPRGRATTIFRRSSRVIVAVEGGS